MNMATRQLAAIMFTDMLGYTALMQTDESEANKRRLRHKQVFEQCIAKYNGRILQYFGDGTLSIFSSTLDCVRCAMEIQDALRLPPKVDVRIGIHSGDVLLNEDGVFGNGVNIASRIETLSVAGGIFISDRVYDDIKNHQDILTRDIGYFDIKNVEQPIHIYAIANEGLVIPSREEIKGKTKQPINTLAVLPFVNLSNDPELEYFSDGITEELLNALTGLDGLRVISRTSSFAFKGHLEDIREIAAKLNVEKILEGSVRQSGHRVRITAQLINASNGFHLWSETYDRDLNDIFQVQDEISKIIANKLRANFLSGDKKNQLVRPVTQNLEAYALFLKGKYYLYKEIPSEVNKAISYFEQAIAEQSDFAHPHALLSAAYALLGRIGMLAPRIAHQKIIFHGQQAVALDPLLPQGHVALSVGYLFFDWNWGAAYQSLMKAKELNPGATETDWVLGYYYIILNEPAKASAVLEQAWLQDPLSMAIARALSISYFYERKYDDCIRLSDMQLEVMPFNWFAVSLKAFALGMKQDWQQALLLLTNANELSGDAVLTNSYLAFCHGRLNQKEEALKYIGKIEAFHRQHPELIKYSDLCLAWCGTNELNKSLDYMHKAVEQKEEMMCYMIHSPVYEALYADPRYHEIKKIMKLPG
jgi:TolB-like protein/class 3 adenylate cyclase